MISSTDSPQSRAHGSPAVTIWLFLCAAMVVAMMLIGAITRLTESGLSMVEWRPLVGALPPLGDAEWNRVFDLYRRTSEYRLENAGMSLSDFKNIFWWEYIHRLWGRLIGAAYGLPLLWFLWRRRIARREAPRFVALLVLGGLQGVIGWWMVKSGFVDRTDVSQYRLAVHLGLAFVILGALLWIGFDRLGHATAAPCPLPIRRGTLALLALVFATALSGALVAGLEAGRIYNDWPLMQGRFFPEDYGLLTPLWLNLFENVAAVQFNHRIMAYLTLAGTAALWIASRRSPLPACAARPINYLFAAVLLQLGLGIATLMLVVPLPLAVLHQAGAIAVFCLAVWAAHTVHSVHTVHEVHR
jgi:cytochrome c oxidase assembly protein subunit 15